MIYHELSQLATAHGGVALPGMAIASRHGRAVVTCRNLHTQLASAMAQEQARNCPAGAPAPPPPPRAVEPPALRTNADVGEPPALRMNA